MVKDRHIEDSPKEVNRGGRLAALTPQHTLALREIVSRMPHATLNELAAELDHASHVRAGTDQGLRRPAQALGC